MSELNNIAKKYGTDKSSEVHNYCVKYEKYLPFERHDYLKILEIGVLNGESLKTWKEYFYNSYIIGIDINPDCKKYEEDKVIVEIGSQIDENFLKYICEKYGPFDMILDDGSHMNEHVIFSFEKLFPYVKPNGVYVMEDTCCSYWPPYGGNHLQTNTMIEYTKKLVDDINFRGMENIDDQKRVWWRKEDILIPISKRQQPDCRTDIESINFLNGITIITKR